MVGSLSKNSQDYAVEEVIRNDPNLSNYYQNAGDPLSKLVFTGNSSQSALSNANWSKKLTNSFNTHNSLTHVSKYNVWLGIFHYVSVRNPDVGPLSDSDQLQLPSIQQQHNSPTATFGVLQYRPISYLKEQTFYVGVIMRKCVELKPQYLCLNPPPNNEVDTCNILMVFHSLSIEETPSQMMMITERPPSSLRVLITPISQKALPKAVTQSVGSHALPRQSFLIP